MKPLLILSILFQLCLVKTAYSQQTPDADITYIGNAGFMINNHGTKIFIDALYNTPNTNTLKVEDLIQQKIMKGEVPFDNSSLFFVSHIHTDHYNADLLKSYLNKTRPFPCVIHILAKNTLLHVKSAEVSRGQTYRKMGTQSYRPTARKRYGSGVTNA